MPAAGDLVGPVLSALLSRQLAVQEGAFGIRPDEMDDVERMAFLRDNILSAIVELTETMNESGWKPWKKQGFGLTDHAATTSEFADVVLFLLNAMLATGVTGEDLAAALDAAWTKNEERQRNGY
jgi:hypothetical protein